MKPEDIHEGGTVTTQNNRRFSDVRREPTSAIQDYFSGIVENKSHWNHGNRMGFTAKQARTSEPKEG